MLSLREERGKAIAENEGSVKRIDEYSYKVLSQSGRGWYYLYPSTGLTLSQTSSLPNNIMLVFTVPVGLGYIVILDYTDCTGQAFQPTSQHFNVLADTTLDTSSFFAEPSPLSLEGIDLVEGKARIDHHHQSISRDGPVNTITASVQNTGIQNICGILAFQFVFPDGSTLTYWGSGVNFVTDPNLATDILTVTPGQEVGIALPFTPTQLGRYILTVTAFWDVVLPVVSMRFSGRRAKTIGFDVVS